MSKDNAPPSAIPPADPRSRAMRHMRKLLQAAAFGGTALGLSACPPMVCDPLPPPLQCDRPDTFSQQVSGHASWAAGDAGTPVVAAAVTGFDHRGGNGIRLTGSPQLDGGSLITSSSDGGTKLDFTFVPNAGATSVTATVSGTCEGTPGSARLTFDVSDGGVVGLDVPFTVSAP